MIVWGKNIGAFIHENGCGMWDQLSKSNFIISTRGRNGGIKLARAASEINIGDLFKEFGKRFDSNQCFNKDKAQCTIKNACKLKTMLEKAEAAYFSVLEQYTLADAINEEISLSIKPFACTSKNLV